jgi:hypothetical protein
MARESCGSSCYEAGATGCTFCGAEAGRSAQADPPKRLLPLLEILANVFDALAQAMTF